MSSLWNNPPYYLTAYGLAVKHGFTGTEEQWLKTLKGDPGKDFSFEKSFDTYEEMTTYYTSTKPSSFVFVGDEDDYMVYWWDEAANEWKNAVWRGPQGVEGQRGAQGPQGLPGAKGNDGVSVVSFEWIEGTHAAGTFDKYELKLSNGQTFPVSVYNGADGIGAGDMMKSVYDPQGKNTDIFQYVLDKIATIGLAKSIYDPQQKETDIFQAIADAVAASVTSVNGETGDVKVTHVALADNLASPDSQDIYDGYKFRTSGGSVSIDSGDAELKTIFGNTVAVGRVPEDLVYVVNTLDLTVGIILADWKASTLGGTGGTYTFSHDGNDWTYGGDAVDLADYGITVAGEPASGDAITVYWQTEVRGTLVTAKPTSFQSIGLNQFDNANNKLADYSIDTSGAVEANVGTYVCWIHAVGGHTYTVYDSSNGVLRIGLYDTIPDTSTTGIEIVTSNVGTSYVDVDHDCYICVVTTTPATLCAHPKWSGYNDATYKAYTESNITIPTADKDGTALPTASYGMPSVGAVRDELSFDMKTYTKRIGQLAYSNANLATVEAMGVPYDYDATNIFYVLGTPVVYELAGTVSGVYTADDFGTEEFIGASVAVYAMNVYGQNLRDKLRSDVLTKTAMTLSTAEQITVRKYLGAQDADAPYAGVDLTEKFAAEIANYTDEWAWIQARLDAENYDGLRPGDYIPVTCTDGDATVLQMQIAGLSCYEGFNDAAQKPHIDFISRDLWPTKHVWNKVNYNNGLTGTGKAFPWLVCDLYAWLNSKSMSVPNGTGVNPATTSVNYATTGVLDKLPSKVTSHLVEKRGLLSQRYNNGSVLSDDNSWGWADLGKLWVPSEVEVYGCTVWGTKGYSHGAFVQYPLFKHGRNRIKHIGSGRADWWLLAPYSGNSSSAAYVGGYGTANYTSASSTGVGAPVCFRIEKST